VLLVLSSFNSSTMRQALWTSLISVLFAALPCCPLLVNGNLLLQPTTMARFRSSKARRPNHIRNRDQTTKSIPITDRLAANIGIDCDNLCCYDGSHRQLLPVFTGELQTRQSNVDITARMDQMFKRVYLVGVALASKFSGALDKSVFLRAFALIFGSELGDKTFWMSAMFAAQHGRLVTSAAVLSVLALHNTAVCGHHNVIVV
jgi:hypothetical protein